MEQRQRAGIWFRSVCAVEFAFKEGSYRIVRRGTWPWRSGGRHGFRAQFANHLFPKLGLRGEVCHVCRVDDHTTRYKPGVVTCHAVLIEDRGRVLSRYRERAQI